MKTVAYIFFTLLLVTFAACVDKKTQVDEKQDVEFEGDVTMQDEREEPRIGEGNVFEALTMDNEGLKIVENAIRRTGLDSVLSEGGPYTLFAPSDAAFRRLEEESSGYAFISDSISTEEMRNILLHHVVRGNLSDAEVASLQNLDPMYGPTLNVVKIDGKVTIDSADIVFGDFKAENGYIHVIDEVLFPD